MIVSFRHKGLKLLYEKNDRSRLRPDIAVKTERFFTALDQAKEPADVDLPGFGLHALRGDRKGFWSVVVSRNHRIVFRFENLNVHDVELIDYH
jgi:proteic killer suppression protein